MVEIRIKTSLLGFVVVGSFLAGITTHKFYVNTNRATEQPLSGSPEGVPVTQLELGQPLIEAEGVTGEEEEEIYRLVERFEALQYEREGDKVLSLFTHPVTQEEVKDWEFITGKDLEGRIRLYVTVLFNCPSNWYMIRAVKSGGKQVKVELRELRTTWYHEPGSYYASINDLVLELVKDDGNFRIEKYYYKEPPHADSLKYDGFFCK